MLRVLAAGVLVVAGAVASAADVDPVCTQILAPAEAEELAGVKPLSLVDASQVNFATGTCNYATKVHSERTLVFVVSVERKPKPHEFEQLRKVAIAPKPAQGLGDEAFIAQGLIGFRKGKTVVSLGAFVDPSTGKRRVPSARLLELAKVVAERI